MNLMSKELIVKVNIEALGVLDHGRRPRDGVGEDHAIANLDQLRLTRRHFRFNDSFAIVVEGEGPMGVDIGLILGEFSDVAPKGEIVHEKFKEVTFLDGFRKLFSVVFCHHLVAAEDFLDDRGQEDGLDVRLDQLIAAQSLTQALHAALNKFLGRTIRQFLVQLIRLLRIVIWAYRIDIYGNMLASFEL